LQGAVKPRIQMKDIPRKRGKLSAQRPDATSLRVGEE
jgi:hypothetical protein